MNVLIVDDETEILNLLESEVESKFMCQVDTATNGLDAFVLCQKKNYDIIVTDHQMPIMNGSAFIISIKTRENLNKKTPVIMITAYSTEGMDSIPELKNVEFLKKPFKFKDLMQKIEKYLA
ncbi:response regulator [Bacteriovorax sp. Seq25_V]|uniref:response regulator n=1 Tax=Bacteriovorax sp. Seq25_V TaxID=1201288 RepID=UPI00038A1090|nr:response regulator [Bacteriovorax sp. Seq25_V]EQC44732.1 response regulator receiver domain protein [Bacteriovorax sp. Seq25_V]